MPTSGSETKGSDMEFLTAMGFDNSDMAQETALTTPLSNNCN